LESTLPNKWLYFCLVGCFFLAIAPFLDLPVLATNTTFIASYGAYLSGTIAPLIALFAFVGILKTLNLQQKQIELLSIDNKRQELVRCIENVEILVIQELSNHEISIKVNDQEYSLFKIMTMLYFVTTYNQIIKPFEEYREEKPSFGSLEIMICESLASSALYITRMSAYLIAYQKLSKERYIPNFYYTKYNHLALRLYSLGYLKKEDFEFWEIKT
jgi:hypothetical protein